MVDLETYRRRIGCYNPKQRRQKYAQTAKEDFVHIWLSFFRTFRWKPLNWDVGDKPMITLPWKVAAALILLLSIQIWLPNDERAGKNRQRPIMDYASEEEKKCFNEIRTNESNLLRAESHLFFFHECQERKIRPTNLEYNGNFNIAFADGDIMEKLKTIDHQNSVEKITTCISHFKLQTMAMKEEFEVSTRRLRSLCDTSRYDFLRQKLDVFARKKKTELRQKKEKKLRKLQWTAEQISKGSDDGTDWIPNLNLKKNDRITIIEGRELEDQHITAAMTLLQKDHEFVLQALFDGIRLLSGANSTSSPQWLVSLATFIVHKWNI